MNAWRSLLLWRLAIPVDDLRRSPSTGLALEPARPPPTCEVRHSRPAAASEERGERPRTWPLPFHLRRVAHGTSETCPRNHWRLRFKRFGNYLGRDREGMIVRIVVIGGSGLIGSKLVTKLRAQGHEAIAASPNTGVNTLTGEGLAEVLKDASVVIDVSNSPSWEDAAVMKFFETSTRNLLTHEAAAGVGHHVALSVVGTDRLSESGYFRAKIAQEKLIKGSSIPWSIVRATQFFEFLKGLADTSSDSDSVRLPPVLFQPMAADDVAIAVGRIAVGPPLNGTLEIGGPEQFRLDDLVRRRLAALKDPREVIADPRALYSGAKISERTLVPGKDARLGEIRFETWLEQSGAQVPSARPQPSRVGVSATD
jgi:uncharacterized protein YbjT (DUF2867 family)